MSPVWWVIIGTVVVASIILSVGLAVVASDADDAIEAWRRRREKR